MLGRRLQLAKPLVADEEESLVLDDRTAESHSVLSHAEWRNGRVSIQVEVIEVTRIEDGIPDIAEGRAVPVIRARLGFYVDLAARLCAVFRVVQSAVDAIFLDCVLGNLQTRLRLLGLLLNAASIDTVNLEVVVVSCAAGEADRSLIAATVILGERCEEGETSPVTPVVGKVCDLVLPDDRGRLGGGAVLGFVGRFHFHLLSNRANCKSNIQSARLADLYYDLFDDVRFEAGAGNRHRIPPNRQTGEAVVAV